MGSANTVAYYQGVVHIYFGPLLAKRILVWLDDILGYASSPTKLMAVLKNVLALGEQYGLKLHPSKCCFFTKEAQ